jgi:DNA-binding transcriptional ArsR family regulator
LVPLSFKRVTVALVLISIVFGCFAAQLYQQRSFKFSYSETPTHQFQFDRGTSTLPSITMDKTYMIAFPISFNVEASTIDQPSFNNSTRMQIANFISENPGIQFRGICTALCLPVGLAQYHLGVLIKAGLVSFVRDGRYKRFFVSKKFSKKDMAAISLLRHKTAKRIIEALLCKKQLSHGRLACEVSVTSQALTWQMKTLKSTEYVVQVNEGLKTVYSLDEASAPMLKKYLAIVK